MEWICFVVAVVLTHSDVFLSVLSDFDLSFLEQTVPLGGSGWLECALWSYVKTVILA